MRLRYFIACIITTLPGIGLAQTSTPPSPVLEARALTSSFQKELKAELVSAMKKGGPTHAIEVCKIQAPKISKEIGLSSGWTIARTSLKTRNTANKPSKLERSILEDFEKRQVSGESLAAMEWWDKSGGTFQYMKAIPMGDVCTVCHGATIAPAVKDKLLKLYPLDMATGFKPGEIRGAFTLKKEY